MRLHRAGSPRSSWHRSANAARSPSTVAGAAFASATNSRSASSACRPIGANGPVSGSERPKTIFTAIRAGVAGVSGGDFDYSVANHRLTFGIEGFVGVAPDAAVAAFGPDLGGDGLAGADGTREARAQAP